MHVLSGFEAIVGGQHHGEKVTVDGTITTGKGPGLVFDFALQLVENIAGKAFAIKLHRDCYFRKYMIISTDELSYCETRSSCKKKQGAKNWFIIKNQLSLHRFFDNIMSHLFKTIYFINNK
jgi:hypothetical protein